MRVKSYVLDLLEEMGISRPEDRDQNKIDSIETRFLNAYQILSTVGKSVADRKMAPERTEEKTAFVAQCLTFGLLDQATADVLLADKQMLRQAPRLPVFNAFTRSIAKVNLGFRADYATSLDNFMAGLRKLDPAFEKAELTHKITENNSAPTSRYQDGDDVTFTLKVEGKTWSRTYRMPRQRNPERAPRLRIEEKFLDLFTSYLNETGNPKILFSAQSIRTTEGPEGIGKYTLLLLTDEEAKALIRWSTVDRFTGPRRYLRPSLR
jgi:hypothetical protein